MFRLRGYHPLCRSFQPASTTPKISYSLPARQHWLNGPTTPHTQRLPAMTRVWFGLFRFRSPLLTESRLFSLPVGTEMFHFPTFPPPALCVQAGVPGHYSCAGFPIRKSPDQSLVGSSPGLIAASNVLPRLLVPRHPPCALTNLATKMLASTVQFSRYGRSRPVPPRARCLPTEERVVRRSAGSLPAVTGGEPEGRTSARALRTQQRA